MSIDDATWLRRERDRREIEEVIRLYFLSLDRQEPAMMEQVFTPDGRLWVDGQLIHGPGSSPPQGGLPQGIPSKPIGFNHMLGNCVITVDDDGDTASAETNAVAYLLIEGDPRQVLVRGLRYLDLFARSASGWRIAERWHNVDWMFKAPAELSVPFAERRQFSNLASQV